MAKGCEIHVAKQGEEMMTRDNSKACEGQQQNRNDNSEVNKGCQDSIV